MKLALVGLLILSSFFAGIGAEKFRSGQESVKKIDESVANTTAKLNQLASSIQELNKMEQHRCVEVTVFCVENQGVYKIPPPPLNNLVMNDAARQTK